MIRMTMEHITVPFLGADPSSPPGKFDPVTRLTPPRLGVPFAPLPQSETLPARPRLL